MIETMSDKAFVIMQVGAKDSPERRRADEIFNYIVKPALAAHSVIPYRSDLDPSPGPITPKMLKELVESRLVIADLTGRNPNVFYELGIVHSFARPLISIADSVEGLPFDAKDERVIALGTYPESGLSYAQGEIAKKSLEESLRVVLEENYDPPSPLKELASTQSLDALAPSNPVASELSQISETLEVILRRVSAPRSAVPISIREDMTAMRSVLEKIMRTTPELIMSEDLITQRTSNGHDEWVRESLGVSLPANPWGNSPTDRQTADPWANSPTVRPSAAGYEEPPF